jgi:hypothetical protein
MTLGWTKSKLMYYRHSVLESTLGLFLGGGLDTNFGAPWNIIYNLPCGYSCGFRIHDNCFGPLGLHLSVMWTLDGLRLFNQWEILEWNDRGPSISCVKWPWEWGNVLYSNWGGSNHGEITIGILETMWDKK